MPKQWLNNKEKQPVSGDTHSERPWYKRVRNLVIIAVLVIAVAVGGWGIYYSQARPYDQTAMEVYGVSLDMRYYLNTLKLYFGKAPAETTIADFAGYVEEQIQQNQLLIQGSKALGVEIPRSEIERILVDSGTGVSRESVDIVMAQELMARQVPSTQTQYNLQAMLLESEQAAQSAMERLLAGEAFDVVSDDVSVFPVGTTDPVNLGWVNGREAELTLGSSKFDGIISGSGAVGLGGPAYDDSAVKGVGYWVAQITEKTYNSDNITPSSAVFKGILIGTEQEAVDIKARLDSGEDMDELAKELSLIANAKENGADLGKIFVGQDASLFEALFDLPLNTIEGPITDMQVQTLGGYWIYNVLEKEDARELTAYQRDLLENDWTARCTTALQENPDYQFVNHITPEMRDFALNKVVMAQGEGSVLIGMTSLPVGEAGVAYSCELKAYGYQKDNTWSITSGNLPDGLELDASSGVISGTPLHGGGGGFTLKVGNQYHYNTLDLTYTIYSPLTILTDSLPDGQAGVEYKAALEVLTDVQLVTWSVTAGNLPDGLSLVKYYGTISGTPAAAGTFTFTVQVDDGLAKVAREFTIVVE